MGAQWCSPTSESGYIRDRLGLTDPWSIGPAVYQTLGLKDPRSIGPFSIIGLMDPRSKATSVYRAVTI